MNIRSVTTLSFNPGTYYGESSFNYCYVKIETDDGLVGYGECSLIPGAVEGAVDTIGEYLHGHDARRIEEIWSSMYYMWHNVRGGVIFSAAMSGIDIALWDIGGKVAGLPVHRLLASFRDSVPAYASSTVLGSPEAYAEEALAHREAGWTAYKIHPPAKRQTDIKVCEATREAVGDYYTLMLDSA